MSDKAKKPTWKSRALDAEAAEHAYRVELEKVRADNRIHQRAFESLAITVVLFEPVLRAYVQSQPENVRNEFEKMVHALHTNLVLRVS